jgi:hypothetical protein
LKRSCSEDCIRFNPVTAHVFQTNARWTIVDGDHRLFDIGPSEPDARQALAVIRRHGFSQACSVGRSDADFSYLRR